MTRVFALVLLLCARLAHAQVVEPTAESMVEGADLVVKGRVESVVPQRDEKPDGSWTELTNIYLRPWRVLVDKTGLDLDAAPTATPPGGFVDFTTMTFRIPGGPSMRLAHFPKFEVGNEYLLLFKDGKLLHAELGAVPVDLDAPPTAPLSSGERSALSPEERLDDDLRRRFGLGAPKQPSEGTPPPAATGASRGRARSLEGAPVTSSSPDSPTEPAIGASPGPWRYFYESPPLVANPPTLTLTQVTRSDDVLGHETTRRALRLAVDALSAASGIHVNLSETIGNESRGYYCGPGLRIFFNDPAEELTPNSNCGGVLAIGGPCPGGTGVLAGGSVLMADDWGNCALWGETNVAAVILHELMHAIGLKHSYETAEAIVTQYQRDAQIAPFLKLGVGAKMFAYDRDATVFLYGPEGNPQPTATAGPTRTPGPTPTFIPTQTPRDPRACPKPATVVGGKCQCPAGMKWKRPKICPRRGGTFSVKCECVDAVIGVGPKGCSDG